MCNSSKMTLLHCLTGCVLVAITGAVDGFLLGSEGAPSDQNITCGTSAIPIHIPRIIGGSEAVPGSWPWMVMLKELTQVVACGGSILNEKVVLTAAHCFEDQLSQNPDRWTAYVGKHHATMTDPMETAHDVEYIIFHPGYDNRTLRNDIAILILKEPITYTDYIRPICMPPTVDRVVPIGEMCYATGWGDTRGTGNPGVLNQVGLPLLSAYWCSRNDWYANRFVFGYTFCAGYASGGKDACAGDSGGPYSCHHDGKWYVQGVTSWGYDCAQPKWPGIYTDVSKYRKWILNTTRAVGCPLD